MLQRSRKGFNPIPLRRSEKQSVFWRGYGVTFHLIVLVKQLANNRLSFSAERQVAGFSSLGEVFGFMT